MKMLQKARKFAIHWHGDQLYGGAPYSYHLDNVDQLVCELYEDSRKLDLLRIVAYLHDILEDTAVPETEIENEFGTQVLLAVQALSKQPNEDIQDYYDRVASNKIAYKVKMADTMSNLTESIKEGQTKRIAKYSNQINELNKRKMKRGNNYEKGFY